MDVEAVLERLLHREMVESHKRVKRLEDALLDITYLLQKLLDARPPLPERQALWQVVCEQLHQIAAQRAQLEVQCKTPYE